MCAMESPARRKPGRPKDPELTDRRTGEILSAAASVFAEHGFAATDVQLVADRVGVGKGTVYRYFPTKDALFLAAVDRGLEELSAEMDAIVLDESRDLMDRLRGAVRGYLAFFHRRPEMAELFIQERAAFRDRHTPRYFVIQEEDDCPATAFIQSLIDIGRLRNLPVERFLTVVGDLLYGTVLSNHLSGRPADPAAQADAILDVVLHGILAAPDRKTRGKS